MRLVLPGPVALLCLSGCLAAPPEAPPPREPQSHPLPLVLDPASVSAGAADEPGATPRAIARDVWTGCYSGFTPSNEPAADLARLAAACGPPAGLRPLTPVHRGHAADESSPPERLAFRARRGRCYRAFAVGGPEALDLDVAFYDPEGRLAAGDVSRDRFPVVPPRGPLCAPRAGVYTIAIAVTHGSGDYVFQIWGTSDRPEPDDDESDR